MLVKGLIALMLLHVLHPLGTYRLSEYILSTYTHVT